ncbi:Peptidase family M23 [compost metagenome]
MQPIKITTEKNDESTVTFWCENTSNIVYSVKIKFSQLGDYINTNGEYIAEVKPGRSRILELKPKVNPSNLSYSFSYFYSKGKYSSKPDSNFIYLLPIAANKQVEIYPITYIGNMVGKENNTFFMQGFRFAQNDTLCAVRSGVVSEINTSGIVSSDYYSSNRNFIEIEQRDGSVATYVILDKLNPMIKVGERVIAGQAIGFLQANDNKPKVNLRIDYLDGSKLEKEQALPYINIRPKFLTDNGIQFLTIKQNYKSIHSEEIIIQEMSKKELKKRHESLSGTKK